MIKNKKYNEISLEFLRMVMVVVVFVCLHSLLFTIMWCVFLFCLYFFSKPTNLVFGNSKKPFDSQHSRKPENKWVLLNKHDVSFNRIGLFD